MWENPAPNGSYPYRHQRVCTKNLAFIDGFDIILAVPSSRFFERPLKESPKLKNARALACLFVGVLLTAMSLGCGSGNYTPPLTKVSKSNNPMVAQYNILTSHAGISAWVEFGLDTNYGRQTSVVTDPSPAGSTAHDTLTVLVAGMLPQTTYHMRAHVNWPGGGSFVDDDQTFTTGAPQLAQSQVFPQAAVSYPSGNTAAANPDPGVELLSMVSPGGGSVVQAFATDLKGNVIWYCPQAGGPVKLLPNGHYFINLGTDLVEMDLACNTIRDVSLSQVNQSLQSQGYSWPALQPFHHDMLALPNGHWIAIAQIIVNYTDLPGYPGTLGVKGDVVLDIDTSGNVAWAWSAFDHLDVNRHLQGLPDWTHSNALVYTADGNLLLSMRHQSWVLKLDYENGAGTGNILWKLGDEGDFTLLGGDPSQWFYAQHYPNILSTSGSQTTMAIWDNGNLRYDSTGGSPCESSSTAPLCYSRAVIMQYDESTHLANLLWEYTPGPFSFWGGSIDVLPNGNVEFDMSEPTNTTSSTITEVTPDPVSPQVVWQMTTTGANAYRGYRMPSLYPGVTWQN